MNLSWNSSLVQFGVGAFETMRLVEGNIPLLPWHQQRLKRFALDWELDTTKLDGIWEQALEHWDTLPKNVVWRVKLLIGLDENQQLTHHVFEFEHQDKKAPRRLMAMASPFSPNKPRDPYKSSSYQLHISAKRRAMKAGFDDALYWAEDGSWLETSTAALMLFDGKHWRAAENGAFLQSVFKTSCFERFPEDTLAQEQLNAEDLKEGPLFMCNALNGLMPIASVHFEDGRELITEQLPDRDFTQEWNQKFFSPSRP